MPHFTTSDGLQIAYHVDDFTDPWTAPPALLLLHAAIGHSRRFYAWVPRLSRHYRVVRMDLRGHGGSSVPAADLPLTMGRLVGDTIELLDHLAIGRAHIVGNSAGGYIAQNLAMSAPERVLSLMLFGSTPGLKHSQAATQWLPRVAPEHDYHLVVPQPGSAALPLPPPSCPGRPSWGPICILARGTDIPGVRAVGGVRAVRAAGGGGSR